MNFLKKWWKIGASLAAVIMLIQGGSCTWNMFKAKAAAAAEAKYQAGMAEKDAAIKAGKEAYGKLSEKAGKDRETIRQRAADELLRSKNAMAALKSESAADLKARNATIAKVLQEKEKDEMALVEAQETIDYLGTLEIATLWAWKISDDNKDAAHAGIVLDLETKYSACEAWRLKIAKDLRPSFWKTAKEWLKLGGAFSAGYAAGRVFK